MAESTTTTTGAVERRQFQTEAKQLLHLMIHSLYSHKEVFIRELISNASDALDRLRFEALTNPAIKTDQEPAIRIKLDKNARTFTISDNGIGMSRQEVIDNIGTIARSGSRAFLEKLTGDQRADSNLIGQFGVGFYSVFMVASRVKLVTKRADGSGPATVWESDGVSEYTIGDAEKETPGTEITLYLNNDGSAYTDPDLVRSVIKRYSDFIAFPIYLPNDKGKEEVVNETKPIWKRKSNEVTAEQYAAFFRQALGGVEDPLETIHMAAEGTMEYSALLFIPRRAAFDLFLPERKHGVKLYVKRVFITDDCRELLPEYLRFVKGVVDSEDLPLNVSREMLQQNPIIARMRRALVKRILSQLADIASKAPERYAEFWEQFGAILKEGLHTDYENRQQLLDLVRFRSTAGSDFVSLRQYVERMKPGQKAIYYLTSESHEQAAKSPHLEVFRAKGIEVLLMSDPVDEFVVPDIGKFDEKPLVSVTAGELDLGELAGEEKKRFEEAQSRLRKFAERLKNILADTVKDVRVTPRLTESVSCLVSDGYEMGAHMERLMKAMNRDFTPAKRVLEINGNHPAILNMNAVYEKNPTDPRLDEWARLLYEQALVAEGQPVPDAQGYARRIGALLTQATAEGQTG